MKTKHRTRTRIGWLTVAVLSAATVGCGRGSIVGSWVGRDRGESVAYTFRADGTGDRSTGGLQQPFTYEFRPGYPSRIVITAQSSSGTPEVRRGLVRVTWDDRMELELGVPGGPSPEQLTDSALALAKPPVR